MRELMSEIGRIEEEKQKMAELRELKRTSQALRVLFVGQRRKTSASSEERRVREVEYNRKWRENNPEKVKILRRRYFEKHREQRYAYLKAWRRDNPTSSRLKERLSHWRTRQAKIARETLKSTLNVA